MAIDILSCDDGDEDYIDMEVSSFYYSYSSSICNSKTSPQQHREFEFQMTMSSRERENNFPADELFYKGNLLPLHLPPRLKMVEKLLQSSTFSHNSIEDAVEECYSTPLATSSMTPFLSCNISPSESCRMSGEINPDKCFLEEGRRSFNNGNSKKSWTRKLKQSSIGLKIKASRAYFKSLFSKSDCSDERVDTKDKDWLDKNAKPKKNLFGEIQKIPWSVQSLNKEKKIDNISENGCHRRSFSMVFKRHLTAKCSSSSGFCSSSNYAHNSNGFDELKFLKRCGSAKSEFESSIQGAIAHCKQSQQLVCNRKTVSEVSLLPSFSASRITVCETQERPQGLTAERAKEKREGYQFILKCKT